MNWRYWLFVVGTGGILGALSGAVGAVLQGEILRWVMIALVCGAWGCFVDRVYYRWFGKRREE